MYEVISNEWLNKNNLTTLWEAIVKGFVRAGVNPVSGGDGGTTKGSIPYWAVDSLPTGTGQPVQPSHLQIGTKGQFLTVVNAGTEQQPSLLPAWTTPQLGQAGGSGVTALTLFILGNESASLTLQAADATHWGVVTDQDQTFGGNKTFKGSIHSEKNVEAEWGIAAEGIADLSFNAGGGGGTVTLLELCGVTYSPSSGIITVPKSELQASLDLGAAAYKGVGVVAAGDLNLVTGDAVNSAINEALTGGMKIEGDTTTPISNGSTTTPVVINGVSKNAYVGMTVFYSSKEFVWTASGYWKELGDESSFALKTTTITGTGYLTGGGSLAESRTLDLSDTAKGYITEGRTAYGYFENGILKAVNMSASNIVTALGSTPVGRATADKNGNDITEHYAVASITSMAIGRAIAMAEDNASNIDLLDIRVLDLESYFDGGTALKAHQLATIRTIWGQNFNGTANVSGAMTDVTNIDSIAYFDVTNGKLSVVGLFDVSENIHGSKNIEADWGVAAGGICDLSMSAGGGGGTVTSIQLGEGSSGDEYFPENGKITLPAYPTFESLGLGSAATHDNEEYLAALGVTGDQIYLLQGDTAQTPITVPYATLSTDTKTELLTGQEFSYRQTAGGGLTYKPSAAVLKRILGRTVAWNQLIPNGNFYNDTLTPWSARRGTATISNGIVTVTRNTSGEYGLWQALSGIAGHKYYISFRYKSESNASLLLGLYNYESLAKAPTFTDYSTIRTPTGNPSQFELVKTGGDIGDTFQLDTTRGVVMIDLTLMFGSGNEPSTVEEFEALYPNAYYHYSPGQLINNAAEGLETVGFNLWDEEWEVGNISDSTGEPVTASGRIRTKNFIPVEADTTYFVYTHNTSMGNAYCYDINKNYIGNCRLGTAVNLNYPVTTLPGTAYLKVAFSGTYGGVYLNNICINKSDSSRNGQYEPYRKNTSPLHFNSFRVKDANGNIVTINGLKQAGSVRDEIVGNKYIKRVGVSTLGTGWSKQVTQNNHWRFQKSFNGYNTATEYNVICNRYRTGATWNSAGPTLQLNSSYNQICVADESYSDVTTFGNAVKDFIINYELATPIEYEIIDDFPTSYPIDVLGTERIVSDELVAPFVADIQYGAKQRDFAWDIDNLASAIADMDISHYSSSVGGDVDTHVIKIGHKLLYIKFKVRDGDNVLPAFDLEVSDAVDDDPNAHRQSFSFDTITEQEILDICQLPTA